MPITTNLPDTPRHLSEASACDATIEDTSLTYQRLTTYKGSVVAEFKENGSKPVYMTAGEVDAAADRMTARHKHSSALDQATTALQKARGAKP